jgi:hypothetical protein
MILACVTIQHRFWRLNASKLFSWNATSSGREAHSPAHQQRLRYPTQGITVFLSSAMSLLWLANQLQIPKNLGLVQ